MPLRYAIHVPTFAEPNVLVDLAVTAEDRGWDGFLLWDHILGSREMTLPIVDSWVALGAIAHATTRIRIGTAITPVPRRRPWKLAREVTTLDRLSHGRAILGVGLGNPIDVEYGPFGEPTDPRILAGRLDEGLEIIDGLFAGEVRYTMPEPTTASTARRLGHVRFNVPGSPSGLLAPGRTAVPWLARPDGTGRSC